MIQCWQNLRTDVDDAQTGRDTTVCQRVPFPERSQCAEGYGFLGPCESTNAIYGIPTAVLHVIAHYKTCGCARTGNKPANRVSPGSETQH